MTRWLCLFSGHDYEATTQRTMDMAPALGVDRIRVYDDVWLEHHPFRRINHHLFETVEKVGYGWHAWKALIILDTMKHSADGDVVMYLDADTYPSGARLEPLYETALREDMMLFDCSGRRHRDWCKRDCFIVMGLDEPKYHESLAGCARFGLWTKGRYRAEQWLYEWLTYSINPFANTRQSGVASKYGAELEGFSIVGIGGVS